MTSGDRAGTPRSVAKGRSAQILIADRDRELAELVAHTLQRAGLRCRAADDERTALELFALERPSVVLLDTNGLDLLDQFSSGSGNAAIIILTAKTSEDARICALEGGVDDYLTKPFSHRELLARVRACLRRSQPVRRVNEARARSRIVLGQLLVDLDQRLATNEGRALRLSHTELRVLHYLMLHLMLRAQLRSGAPRVCAQPCDPAHQVARLRPWHRQSCRAQPGSR
jgi:DNA-binding response OmpR family regulator